MKKASIIFLLVLFFTFGFAWWFLGSKNPSEPAAKHSVVQSKTEVDTSAENYDDPANAPKALPVDDVVTAPGVPEAGADYPQDNSEKSNDLERALQSMRESLFQQDDRTPEMSQPMARELPTAEELADPALYEAYELRQTKKMAAVFAGVSREIPVIRDKIDAARLTGSHSPEELEEAEDALAKMESLQEMLRLKFPDIEEETAFQIQQLEQNNASEQKPSP